MDILHAGIKDMANLNFQQPPRSIPSQNLSRSAFNSTSISGHVTPTSNMFPGSTNSFTPQQISPSRNPASMGSRSLFNQQRSFSERRPVQSIIQDWLVYIMFFFYKAKTFCIIKHACHMITNIVI